jgi:superoxide dismutase, Fe-Mn family
MKITLRIAMLALLGTRLLQADAQHQLPALPYGYAALEIAIDSTTMRIHHTKHHAAYVNQLNEAVKETEAAKLSVEEILSNISSYSEKVRNNAGGHYNHSMFWTLLSPDTDTRPSAKLETAIRNQFGNVDSLITLMNKAAATRFGSGWAWLIVNDQQALEVCSTPNQDNPLMDISPVRGIPILGIDVWEHAYYLRYQNKRADYLGSIWKVINWNEVSKRFEAAVN